METARHRGSRFPPDLPALYESWPRNSRSIPKDPLRPPRARTSPRPPATASASTCRSPIAARSTSLCRAPSSPRPTTAITAPYASRPKPDPTFQQSDGRDHLGPRHRLLSAPAAPGRTHRLALQLDITLPIADYFKDGGWVYFSLPQPADFGLVAPASLCNTRPAFPASNRRGSSLPPCSSRLFQDRPSPSATSTR